MVSAMAVSARRTVWFRTGLGPAFFAALLPILVALFHLAPPALGGEPAAHHGHAGHGSAAHGTADMALAADDEDDCHPADTSAGQQPGSDQQSGEQQRRPGPHCPLCLWLKAFHALPAPEAVILRLQNGGEPIVPRREPPARSAAIDTTAQPRAPPHSPAA
jgi:hypothetical protein